MKHVSTKHMIHMKFHDVFSLKIKQMSSAAVMIGALRVNLNKNLKGCLWKQSTHYR